MKNWKEILIILLSLLLLFTFIYLRITKTGNEITNGKYVKGKIILKPNGDQDLGIARVFINPSNGLDQIYGGVLVNRDTYNKIVAPSVQQEIFFRIRVKNGVPFAFDAKIEADKSELFNDLNILSKNVRINLHEGNVNDGTPWHSKTHIILREDAENNPIIINQKEYVKICLKKSLNENCKETSVRSYLVSKDVYENYALSETPTYYDIENVVLIDSVRYVVLQPTENHVHRNE